MADMNEMVAFLESLGAGTFAHSGGTFLEHLVGVAEILERWGASEAAQQVGLFHSVYGTESFHGAVLSFDDRKRVKALLGEEAEHLAYVFCACDRGSIHRAIESAPYVIDLHERGAVTLSREELTDLVHVLWANDLEQSRRMRLGADRRARARRAIERATPFLPAIALEELAECYGPTWIDLLIGVEDLHGSIPPGVDVAEGLRARLRSVLARLEDA